MNPQEFVKKIDRIVHQLKYALGSFAKADDKFHEAKKELYEKIVKIEIEIMELVEKSGINNIDKDKANDKM